MIPNKRIIESSMAILKILLAKQELSRESNPSLYDEYRYDNEVEEMTHFLCGQMGLDIYVFKERLYLTAGIENSLFGYSNQDIKDDIPYIYTNTDLNTVYFTIHVLVTMFYKQSGIDTSRSFIKISELAETINNKLDALVSVEDIETVSSDLEFNFAAVSRNWQKKPNVKLARNGEVSSSGNSSRYALVNNACDFLEKHKLIKIVREQDILVPTDRFKGIVYHFFEDKQNKTDLLDFIEALNVDKGDIDAKD